MAVTRVLDEADIIEAFVRHTATFVTHHVVIDNGSTDGTIEILRQLRDEGLPLTLQQNLSVSYVEQNSNTSLYRTAVAEHAADWVLFLDADEFVDDRGVDGGWPAALSRWCDAQLGIVRIPVHEYVARAADDAAERLVSRRMGARFAQPSSTHVFVRGLPGASHAVVINNGAHHAWLGEALIGPEHLEPGLALAHFSERETFQYLAKVVRGWTKVVAAGRSLEESGTSFHYRGPFEMLRDRPADLLRNAWFMGTRHDQPDLVVDPISYRGGELRYTGAVDDAMRAVRSLAGYLEHLARRHGRLLDESPEARGLVERWDAELHPIT